MAQPPGSPKSSAAFFRRFVAERQPVWGEAQALIAKSQGDPGALAAAELLRLAELYPETAADLAFVQREFGSGRLAEHLSFVVGESYRLLYFHGGERRGGFRSWLAETLPRAARAMLPDLAVLSFLFLAASLVGFFFTVEHPAFGRANRKSVV